MSGAENGAERPKTYLSGAVSGVKKSSGKSSERERSRKNLPLKICSVIYKTTQSKKLKSILKVTTKLSVKIHYYFVCVENNDYLEKDICYLTYPVHIFC